MMQGVQRMLCVLLQIWILQKYKKKRKKNEQRRCNQTMPGDAKRVFAPVCTAGASCHFPRVPIHCQTRLHNNYTSLRWSWNSVHKSTQQLTTKCFFFLDRKLEFYPLHNLSKAETTRQAPCCVKRLPRESQEADSWKNASFRLKMASAVDRQPRIKTAQFWVSFLARWSH